MPEQPQEARSAAQGRDDYPEHEKLAAVADDSQTIGEFLDGCHYEPIGSIEDVLAEWFGIDRDALEREKRAMLDSIRAANRG